MRNNTKTKRKIKLSNYDKKHTLRFNNIIKKGVRGGTQKEKEKEKEKKVKTLKKKPKLVIVEEYGILRPPSTDRSKIEKPSLLQNPSSRVPSLQNATTVTNSLGRRIRQEDLKKQEKKRKKEESLKKKEESKARTLKKREESKRKKDESKARSLKKKEESKRKKEESKAKTLKKKEESKRKKEESKAKTLKKKEESLKKKEEYLKKKEESLMKKKQKLIIVETFKKTTSPLSYSSANKNIKISSEGKESMEEKKESVLTHNNNNNNKRLNETFIELMEKLSNIMMKRGEPFRARAYQKAQETIMSYEGDILNPDQLKNLPNIGKIIMEKLEEYNKTGTLSLLEREKINPINLLGDIYGVGPKKAKELVDKGITTIAQLREKQSSVLNDVQRVGLKYYEDILERIPRSEIDQFSSIFESTFKTVATPESNSITDVTELSPSPSLALRFAPKFEIVGSYRRGALNSGDIDVIITADSGDVFKKFIDELLNQKIILEVLSRGQTKCLVIAKLPNSPFARRVDFLYTNPKEYPFSVLYFTGSKIFNTVMRAHAQKMGYSLNEHGLYKMEGKSKGQMIDNAFTDEADIFKFLHMVYKNPNERIDGRAVVVVAKEAEIPSLVEPSPIMVEPSPIMAQPSPILAKKAKKTKTKLVLVPEEKEEKEENLVLDIDAKVDNDAIDLVQKFRKAGISFLEELSEQELASIVNEANKAFHYNKTPIMSDNEYDIVKEYMAQQFPTNPVLEEVGAPIEKNKVKLPYEMWSMDKIKPDSDAINIWKKKYKGPYVLSCKMDGVSGMYSTEGGIPKLYTRGNGKVGQDVSHLIPYLKFPKLKKNEAIVVRGEFLILKSVFEEKYASTFANPRNLVAGIVNRQTLDEKVKDLHFVAYEVIVPQLKPSEQMSLLKKYGFEVVLNSVEPDVSNELLSEKLVDWRKNYLYEIDGVIVTADIIEPRKSGNPDHSFAFKMILSDQIAEAKVVDVIWTASKDGYLKPRVRIEPIHLGGVKIEYATGFNGAFIEANKIGVGAIIQLIRSGDVIPHIRSVTTPAIEAKMPNVGYKWNDTHVDIMLEDIKSDATVREKNITGFFKGIGVDGLSGGNVARIISAGYDSVPKIIHMTKSDFFKVSGFKEKLATKIFEGIKEKLEAASIIELMSASNIFGRGFSDKRISLVLESYPSILTSEESEKDKIKMVTGVKGMALKTAESFIYNIPAFVTFLEECGLQQKLQSSNKNDAAKSDIDTSHPLYKKSVVFTGVRDPIAINALKSVGGILGSSVSKNTCCVIAKNAEEDTGKALDAKKLGIPIMTPNEFMEKYFH